MIRYEPEFPADIREIVGPMLQRWAPLIPTWCQEFTVRFDPRRDDRMAVTINYRSRWATLIVTGQWLQDPAEEREVCLVHELVHVCQEPFQAAINRVVEDVTEEGTPLRSLVDSMVSDGLEAATEDTARGIFRLLSERAP